MKFNLGDRVKDKVTSFEGVVIGHAEYLSGCDTFCVQPHTKDGAWVEARWFDEPRLELVQSGVVAALDDRKVKTGADDEAPTR